VLDVLVDAVTGDEAQRRIVAWARDRESRSVCFCNVHSAVTAHRDPAFREVVNGADLVVADGAPVAWAMRRLGHPGQERIAGPDAMLQLCALAAEEGIGVFLYGSTGETLRDLQAQLLAAFPRLRLAGAIAPPFQPLTAAEDADVCQRINASGAGLVFVGLGCPKQERWMAEHRGRIPSVTLGVGAAFDFHSGRLKRAPGWLQTLGLEWLHRLLMEPARLWRRYLTANVVFVVGLANQLVRERAARAASERSMP